MDERHFDLTLNGLRRLAYKYASGNIPMSLKISKQSGYNTYNLTDSIKKIRKETQQKAFASVCGIAKSSIFVK